jgi:hypothetical protein
VEQNDEWKGIVAGIGGHVQPPVARFPEAEGVRAGRIGRARSGRPRL